MARDELSSIARIVRDLGFPIVVALLLIFKVPGWIRETIAADAGVRQEQHKALVEVLQAQSRAFEACAKQLVALTAQVQGLQNTSSMLRGVVIGKYRCAVPSARAPEQLRPRSGSAAAELSTELRQYIDTSVSHNGLPWESVR